MRRFATLLILIYIGLPFACSKDPDSPRPAPRSKPQGDYEVVDRFGVGKSVVVRAMALDKQAQQLWVGTSVGALLIQLHEQKVLQRYTRDNGLANEYIFAAMVDTEQNVWLGSNGGGVSNIRKDGKLATYFPMHGLADYWVYSFAQRKNGDIWIGTWNGISVLRQGAFTTYLKELVNEWVYGLAVDSKDRVWVGTEGGVNMFDGNKWHMWTHKDGVGSKNHRSLPPSDNTGLGTRDRHNLSTLSDGRQTYNPNYIFSVLVDKQDKVWVGTWGGGVSVFTGKSWQNYNEKHGLTGSIVYSLAYDAKRNRIWAGTNKGLFYLQENRWHAALPDAHIYAVVVDEGRSQIWAGTHEAVMRLAARKKLGETK